MKNLLYTVFASLCLLLLTACNDENELLKKGEMLFLKHKGASMPLLVRGNFNSDVILLMVHGGAGGSSGSHIEDFNEMIEPEYMVAYWDQRHAGSSQGNFDKEDLTIDLMAEDMQMVINLLKHKYGSDKKIFAVGHSWGVQLTTYYLLNQENQLQGAILTNGSHSSETEYSARLDFVNTFASEMIQEGLEIPKKIEIEGETFTSLEQVVTWTEQNDPIDSWRKLKILWPLVDDVVLQYVNDTYVLPYNQRISAGELLFKSPYNQLIGFINLRRTGQLINDFDNEKSIQEFYDYRPEMDQITLPVCLIWGKYDQIIGLEVADSYYDVIGTPQEDKELVILENSGHSGLATENVKFSQTVISFVEEHK